MEAKKLVFPPCSYTGWGALRHLVPEVEKYAPQNILLVTDPVLVRIGLANKVTVPLRDKGFSVTVFDGVVPEPPLKLGEDLVKYAKENKFDLVIGLGGGSALDLAKLTAVLSVHDGSVAQYLNLTGPLKISKKGLPKILIPTTSGTGSEVTNISVLSLERTKDVVTHDYLLADVAIVDPELTVSMPPKVTAATGVDALTHAVEAYLSVHASPTSDALALHAIRLIGSSLRKAVQDGNDRKARSDMSQASYMAGLSFFNAGVAGVHALAYPLGGQFHIAHGEANAVLLPYVMDYIRPSCMSRLADVYQMLGGNGERLSEDEASLSCVRQLMELVRDVGIPTTLRDFGIGEKDLEALSLDAAKQTRLLSRSPMPLNLDDIRAIYRNAYLGKLSVCY